MQKENKKYCWNFINKIMERNSTINRSTIKIEKNVVGVVAVLKGIDACVVHNFFETGSSVTVVQEN